MLYFRTLLFVSHEKKMYHSTPIKTTSTNQKQPPEVVCETSCSLNFRKIHLNTPVPESFFNKVATVFFSRPSILFFVFFELFKRKLMQI